MLTPDAEAGRRRFCVAFAALSLLSLPCADVSARAETRAPSLVLENVLCSIKNYEIEVEGQKRRASYADFHTNFEGRGFIPDRHVHVAHRSWLTKDGEEVPNWTLKRQFNALAEQPDGKISGGQGILNVLGHDIPAGTKYVRKDVVVVWDMRGDELARATADADCSVPDAVEPGKPPISGTR